MPHIGFDLVDQGPERLRFREEKPYSHYGEVMRARAAAGLSSLEVVLRRERIVTLKGVAHALAVATRAEREAGLACRRAEQELIAPNFYRDMLVEVNRYRVRSGLPPLKALVLDGVAFVQLGHDDRILRAVPCDHVASLQALRFFAMDITRDLLAVSHGGVEELFSRLTPAEGVVFSVFLHQVQQTMVASGLREHLSTTCRRLKTLLLRHRRLGLIHTILEQALSGNQGLTNAITGTHRGGSYVLRGNKFMYASKEELERGVRKEALTVPENSRRGVR